ncbi:MAG TPA: hypothetical protein VKA94_11625 [Hyphomicrobiales bacterium]|nr:hypothetical protein [Hyphomicrobiales bacterium]
MGQSLFSLRLAFFIASLIRASNDLRAMPNCGHKDLSAEHDLRYVTNRRFTGALTHSLGSHVSVLVLCYASIQTPAEASVWIDALERYEEKWERVFRPASRAKVSVL